MNVCYFYDFNKEANLTFNEVIINGNSLNIEQNKKPLSNKNWNRKIFKHSIIRTIYNNVTKIYRHKVYSNYLFIYL